jgi:hypothetical protein
MVVLNALVGFSAHSCALQCPCAISNLTLSYAPCKITVEQLPFAKMNEGRHGICAFHGTSPALCV